MAGQDGEDRACREPTPSNVTKLKPEREIHGEHSILQTTGQFFAVKGQMCVRGRECGTAAWRECLQIV